MTLDMAAPYSKVSDDQVELFNNVLKIVAEELDYPVEELQDDDVKFSEIGLDPIVASPIITKISQSIGVHLPDGAFDIFPDVGRLKQHVIETSSSTSVKTSAMTVTGIATDYKGELLVLLQGNRSKASRTIFLLPDGSGSAMAYVRLPAVSSDCCIYGLNSPFLQETSKYNCSVEHLASIWAQEIKTIQPHGPYTLGGWSAGGYYAYEVMKYFHRMCEVVETLILIDSPCRTDFEALPLDVILYLSSHNLMGNWGNAGAPSWLIDHFKATLRAVDSYKPTKITPSNHNPSVFIIWASGALLQENTTAQIGLDPNVKVTRFLLEPRADFGSNGWEKLLPGANMEIATVPGNHFNITHPPNASAFIYSSHFLDNSGLTYYRFKLSAT